jgi:putative ABC transport system ATP-binding protein
MIDEVDNSILALDQVSLAYFDGDRATYALQEVSIALPKNEFIGIMGPSGSGKSSLLYVLSGLKRPTSGDAYFNGKKLTDLSQAALSDLRRESFGFVFQQPWLLPWQTALENTLMGAIIADKNAENASIMMLESLGVGQMANKMPSQLSGGEKQRVCVARAMMNRPAIIFADEPTASLDHRNGHAVIDLLAAYKERGTVVVVTHDAEMLSTADRILIMRDGKKVEWVTASELKTSQSVGR